MRIWSSELPAPFIPVARTLLCMTHAHGDKPGDLIAPRTARLSSTPGPESVSGYWAPTLIMFTTICDTAARASVSGSLTIAAQIGHLPLPRTLTDLWPGPAQRVAQPPNQHARQHGDGMARRSPRPRRRGRRLVRLRGVDGDRDAVLARFEQRGEWREDGEWRRVAAPSSRSGRRCQG